MTIHSYRLLNVFVRRGDAAGVAGRVGSMPAGGAGLHPERLTGNPLCVFEDGASLDERSMQALARQFNLSETTFILPSQRASARVRIFTPAYEMPFAGHPTLGTAHVCRELGIGGDALTLEMAAGTIPVSAHGDRWTLEANPPRWREVAESREALAAMLGLEPRDIAERPLWVSTGREQLIVPLASEEAVRRARPSPERLGRFASEEGASMAYVFAPRAPSAGPVSDREALVARFFFPQGPAILEDPATGSATANLGGWCIATRRALPSRFEISQGEQASRPSTLHLEVDAERRIRVSGEVIELGRGTITL